MTLSAELFDHPLECSECGHEHFLLKTRTFIPCPLREEGCPCDMEG